MNESRVIALRFRPKTFDQVVGQDAIVRTLTNAIKSGSLHHAYLFGGARGVGKTTTARLVARALNCAEGPTTQPCGVCPSCVDIAESRSMLVTEIDAASNTSVDNVRQVIVTSSTFSPGVNQYRIFIIDEVHQLSGAAFNALLKTIEEPPPRVVFIMATTELQKVPDTILSRCQVFEFRTIPLSKIVAELKRIAAELGIKISDSALGTIARAGEGSMRDAESAFDQVISFAGAEVSDEDVSAALGLPGFETLRATVEAVADQDSQAILRIVDTIVTRGYDIRNFCREVMTYIRNLLVVKVAGFDQELTQMPQSEAEWTTRLADRFSDQDLIRFFSILSKTEQDIRLSSQPRFQLEIGLVKMAQAARLYPIEEAIDRMAAIEAGLKIQSPSDQALPPRPTPNAMGSATQDRAGGASKRTDRSATTTAGHPKRYSKRTSETPSESSGSTGVATTRNSECAARAELQRAELDAVGGAGGHTTDLQETMSNQVPGQGSEPEKVPAQAPALNTPEPLLSKQPHDIPKPVSMVDRANGAGGARSSEDPGSTDSSTQVASATETVSAEAAGPATDPHHMIEKIKRILESRKKMLLAAALDHAQHVAVNDHYLMVGYDPSDAGRHYKAQIEDARRIVEEACYEALGKRLTLSASLGGLVSPRQGPGSSALPRPDPKANDITPENHPAVRAIIERFNGEIIDVDVPDR